MKVDLPRDAEHRRRALLLGELRTTAEGVSTALEQSECTRRRKRERKRERARQRKIGPRSDESITLWMVAFPDILGYGCTLAAMDRLPLPTGDQPETSPSTH